MSFNYNVNFTLILIITIILIGIFKFSNGYVPPKSYYINEDLIDDVSDCPNLTEYDGGYYCMGNGGVIEIIAPKKYSAFENSAVIRNFNYLLLILIFYNTINQFIQ
ncbi:uncharacterized protein LOC129605209 [Condylostylus longicornis]|uniref:uncharacterized protein LOC129605209 n=1 Tax=Condylostylus longicornis TaxID=2530218 RepID=UPI00244DBD70|nr:uncharacterized protein LOC129605209 [Condylostylus longicornis]